MDSKPEAGRGWASCPRHTADERELISVPGSGLLICLNPELCELAGAGAGQADLMNTSKHESEEDTSMGFIL